MTLQIHINPASVADKSIIAPGIMLTPPVGDESYYLAKVPLGDDGQAIKAFPKFGLVGLGFAKEHDWNCNLPIECPADDIWSHIRHNKCDEAISDKDCLSAIEMLQAYFNREEAQK